MDPFGISTHVGAVTREVRDVERDGRPARTLVAARTYPTDVDDLWHAITDPERLPRWFLPVTGDLRVGGRYQTEGNAGGTILACDPPTRLAVTWEFGDDVTWLEVTLSPTPGGTELRLEHTAHPSPHWEQFGPGAVGIGWELALVGLAWHVRSGDAVDPAAAMAWQASPDGLELARQVGRAWGEADIAGGADPGAARAAAERTIAFYTTVPDGDGGNEGDGG